MKHRNDREIIYYLVYDYYKPVDKFDIWIARIASFVILLAGGLAALIFLIVFVMFFSLIFL